MQDYDRRQLILRGLAVLGASTLAGGSAWAQSPTFEGLLEQIQASPEQLASADFTAELAEHEFPLTSGGIGSGIDANTIRYRKKSYRSIGGDALNLIVFCEVTSEDYYKRHWMAPTWPKGDSGITMGVGYDMGYTSPDGLSEDWQGYLDDATIARLAPYTGKKGADAAAAVSDLKDISVEWSPAKTQFKVRTLPVYTAETESNFENTDQLPTDAFGALVSLVMNRGSASYFSDGTDPEGRRAEMREIKSLMSQKKFADIPTQLRKMTRLWPNAKGLIARRNAEALLFEQGLALGST